MTKQELIEKYKAKLESDREFLWKLNYLKMFAITIKNF